jgi:hypothetical protein
VTAQEVRVYQSYDGREVFRIDLTPVERAGQNFALSPDGMRLAVMRETQVHHAATKDYGAYTQKETGVEVYALPPPTKEDEAAVKSAEAQAPADTGARIDTSIERVSASDAAAAGGASSPAGDSPAAAAAPADASQQSARGATNGGATNGDSVAEAGAGTATGAGNATGTGTTVEGDAEPEAPRKPPTLYGPGEKPEKPQ